MLSPEPQAKLNPILGDIDPESLAASCRLFDQM